MKLSIFGCYSSWTWFPKCYYYFNNETFSVFTECVFIIFIATRSSNWHELRISNGQLKWCRSVRKQKIFDKMAQKRVFRRNHFTKTQWQNELNWKTHKKWFFSFCSFAKTVSTLNPIKCIKMCYFSHFVSVCHP